jgi:3-methyl-2-oxobutanoate hydroxymethyltransferase
LSSVPHEAASQFSRKRTTPSALIEKKVRGVPITMLTGYDYPTSIALDNAGVDGILVGDSLGMVVLGYENTLPVTMEEMLHHCRAVSRGAHSALLIGDMPFMSYQVSIEQAVRNAGRFLQDGGMQAVKLEGGRERLETIRAIVASGIPLMGHLGLMPQSINMLGGYHPQGRTAKTAKHLFEEALLLQDSGCFALVLESVPARLAELISKRLTIPTIGIGAGAGCDGQILVSNDMLGLFDRFTPKFVRKYADLHSVMQNAFEEYIADVGNRVFPARENSVDLPDKEWESFLKDIHP